MKEGWDVVCTSRQPHTHLTAIPSQHRIRFDLEKPETWSALPAPAHIIWCFPASPPDAVQRFVAARQPAFLRTVVLGSTSAYPSNGQIVTPDHAPNPELPRVQGEEFLRATIGAVVIRLAGLYGPGRHLLNWLREGKVRHSHRLVNLIHVDDAVGICLSALTQAPAGSTYVASDGTPRRWSAIYELARLRWAIPTPPLIKAPDPGKHIDPSKLLKELGYHLRWPDVYEALEALEAPTPSGSNTKE